MRALDRATLAARLSRLSFVRKASTGESFVLHDEMRRLVVKYCWEELDLDRRQRRNVSICVIDYCEDRRQQLTPAGRADEAWLQLSLLIILHHCLFISPDDGLSFFQHHFLDARMVRKRVFARLLFQEVQQVAHTLSPAQKNAIQLAEVQLLRLEDNPDQALCVIAQIEETHDPHWFAENSSSLLNEQGQCYQMKNQWSQALQCINACLQTEAADTQTLRRATLFNQRGYIARRLDQFAAALQDYRQSARLYKEAGHMQNYAYVLNNMSNVYRYQDKREEALMLCRIGWNLRCKMVAHGEADELAIGWSLSTPGLIHLSGRNIAAAEHFFHKAHDMFQRAHSQKDLSTIYVRFGHVCFEQGK